MNVSIVLSLRLGGCVADHFPIASAELGGFGELSFPEQASWPTVGYLSSNLLMASDAVLDFNGERLYVRKGPVDQR